MAPFNNSISRRMVVSVAGASASLIGLRSHAGQANQVKKPFTANATKRGFVDGPYGQIHYRFVVHDRQSKIPLICLHSTPMSALTYESWLLEMGVDRPCFAPDTPGYGDSAAPPSPVAIPEFGAAIIRFMDELNIQKADIIGYRTGALTCVEIARRFPNRIGKVVLVSLPIFDDAYRKARLKEMDAPLPGLDDVVARWLDGWRKEGKGRFRDVPTDERYWDISLEMMSSYRTRNWGYRGAYSYDLLSALAETKQPILVLNIEDDIKLNRPRADAYLNKLSQTLDMPTWTHGFLDGHKSELAQVVRNFLQ